MFLQPKITIFLNAVLILLHLSTIIIGAFEDLVSWADNLPVFKGIFRIITTLALIFIVFGISSIGYDQFILTKLTAKVCDHGGFNGARNMSIKTGLLFSNVAKFINLSN